MNIVSGKTYMDLFLHRATTGRNKGRMFCFPCFQKGWCYVKRDSKLPAIMNCDVGEFDYEDIGIAFDEKDRFNQLNESKRSILVEQEITEAMAKEYCEINGVLSPRYKEFKRDGCALCPQAKEQEREKWFSDYPEARDLVIALQNIAIRERPEQYPLRNYQWFIWQPHYEGYQLDINDIAQ